VVVVRQGARRVPVGGPAGTRLGSAGVPARPGVPGWPFDPRGPGGPAGTSAGG